jgi:hypothetical protein
VEVERDCSELIRSRTRRLETLDGGIKARSYRSRSTVQAAPRERDGGFLTDSGNDCNFCATFLKIEDRIGGVTLRKEELFWFQSNYSSTEPCAGQKGYRIEFLGGSMSHPCHLSARHIACRLHSNESGTRLNCCQCVTPRMAGVNCNDYRSYV